MKDLTIMIMWRAEPQTESGRLGMRAGPLLLLHPHLQASALLCRWILRSSSSPPSDKSSARAGGEPDFLAKLRTHCAFCNQWVSLKSPGTKQHIRLTHPITWSRKDDANSFCSAARSSSLQAVCILCRDLSGAENTRQALSCSLSGRLGITVT